VDYEFIIVLISLIFSFFFSASETALTALGRLEVESILSYNDSRSKLIKEWVQNPNRLLTTILVGNNITNIIASSVFTLWVEYNYPASTVVLIAIFTLSLIVFVEIIPKIVARQFSTRISPWSIRILGFIGLFLFPVVYVVQKFSTGIVSLSGMPGRTKRTPFSEEELTKTIQLAAKEGGIDRETGEVLENLIEFPDTLAKDIMVQRGQVEIITMRSTLQDILNIVSKSGFSRYPVVRTDLDNVVGILIVKDLINYIQKGSLGNWTRILRRPTYVSELALLGTILRDMKRSGMHMALVRNETGVLTGLLTFEDLIEEIVGEIRDETDAPEEAGGVEVMGGPQIISGDIPVVDFNDRYHQKLPLDISYSTLNGYILYRTGGKLPPEGTLIFEDDFSFRLHSISQKGVATLELIDQLGQDEEIRS